MSHTQRQPSVPVVRLGSPKGNRRNLNLPPELEERTMQVSLGERRFTGSRDVPSPRDIAKIIRDALSIGLDVLEMKYRMTPSQECRECGHLQALAPGAKRRLS
jgi:hypothetical protein